MSNLFEHNRLSQYVSGLVNRKLKAITLAITDADGYLHKLINDADTLFRRLLTDTTQQNIESRNEADRATLKADESAASALAVNNNMRQFFATYLGVNETDPTRSSLGDNINHAAFGIRSSDGRLRYATRASNGMLSWQDATVRADPQTVREAADEVLLFLSKAAVQTVTGPVTFQGTMLVPRITNWSSQQAVAAQDFLDTISALSARTVTGAGLIKGSGRNDQDVTLTVSSANFNQMRAGAADDVAATPKSLKDAGAIYVVDAGENVNGRYRVYSDGHKECWGLSTVTASTDTTITLPIAHTAYCMPVGNIYLINSDEQNVGIVSTGTESFVVRNPNPRSGTFFWHTKGT